MRLTALLVLPIARASVSQHAARIWALRNSVSLETGWRIFSVAFYGDEGCSEELIPETILDGGHYDDGEIRFTAGEAFDGKSLTLWVAQCGKDSITGRPCAPYEAWIGADFGSPVVVYCVRICQAREDTSSSQITLSKEGTSASSDGSLWVDVTTWSDLPSTAECVSRQSGISKLSSISYAPPFRNRHCARQSLGQSFSTYVLAKASCDLLEECVGIYDQECGPMYTDISFQLDDRDKWNRFLNNLDAAKALISSFNEESEVILSGSSVALEDQARLTLDAPLPRTIRVHLAASGRLLLCGELPDIAPISKEGSCLHLKTGALLQFTLQPNTRAITELKRTITATVEECAEACISLSGCLSFLQVHKSGGDELTENNCQLQGLVTGTEQLDGSIDVADLYVKRSQPPSETDATDTKDVDDSTGSGAETFSLSGLLVCLLYWA